MAEAAEIRVSDYHEAALLHAAGKRFVRTEVPAGGSRVTLIFDDDGGKSKQLLKTHRGQGVQMNSQDFVSSLAWAKNNIFAAREEAGLPGPRGRQ